MSSEELSEELHFGAGESGKTTGPTGALTTATQAQYQVQRRLLLDVVVAQRAAILELLARKDEALLVRGDALLVLDLLLHVLRGQA
jgi:hypothetical protein